MIDVMRRSMWAMLALSIAAPCFWASAARAQATSDVDRARALAIEAADALDEKRYAEALEQATRAEELYHAPVHTFTIAAALEGLGRLAEAATTYEKLVAEPLPATAPAAFRDAQAEGQRRLNALLARVPSILVRVADAPPGAVAKIDGAPFDLAAAVAKRLDPGEHHVTVTAEGYEPFERSVTLPAKGGVVVVEAALRRPGEPAEPPPPAAPAAPELPPADAPSRAPAIAAFGVGAVGVGVGAVTGILFLGKLGDLEDRCPNDRCTTAEQADIDSAGLLGNISTIAFGVGAAGLATGVILLLVSSPAPSPGKKAAAVASVSTRIAPGWIGLGGSF